MTAAKAKRTSAPARKPASRRQDITARLEARVPQEVIDLMKVAADMKGLSLTSYVIETMGEKARRDIEDMTLIRLAVADQLRFAESLVAPPAPNRALRDAAAAHKALVAPR